MDIGGAVSKGIARSQRILFRPFNLGTFFSFGFAFLLAGLIDPVLDWNGKLEMPDFGRHSTTPPPTGAGPTTTLPDPLELPPEILDAYDHYRTAIAAAVVTGLVLSFVLGIVLLWIGCRGLMMSYRSVSVGYIGIGDSWRETARSGNALFRQHLLVHGIGAVLGLPMVYLAWSASSSAYAMGQRDVQVLVRLALPYLLAAAAVGLACWLVLFVVRQFIAPFLLFLEGGTLRAAWSRFFRVVSKDPGGVVVFVLARVLLAVVIGVLSSFLSTLTCCIGGLPLVHQAILAPALAFDRAFTLHALASIDAEYAVMAPELPPPYAAIPWQK